jgi:hypothetical protein
MFIPDQDFEPSRIPDYTKTTKEDREKNGYLKLSLYLEISKSGKFFSGTEKFEPVDKELLYRYFSLKNYH